MLLFNLVTGQMPFAAPNEEKVKKLTLTKEPKYVKRNWRQLSPDVQALCKNMLSKDPNQRMSFEEILDQPWINDMPTDNFSRTTSLGGLRGLIKRRS